MFAAMPNMNARGEASLQALVCDEESVPER
jgi:hypothetical protein